MRVVIDGRSIRPGKTGIGVYAENILLELCHLGRRDEFILLVGHRAEKLKSDNLKIVRLDVLNRRFVQRLWENAVLPSFLSHVGADVYFSPSYILPLRKPRTVRISKPLGRKVHGNVKFVATVHDLASFLHPETTTPLMRLRLRLFLPPSLRAADLIITDSIASKSDIVRTFQVPQDKIRVIPLGKSERFVKIRDRSRMNAVRRRYKLPESFILNLGTIEPRKNLEVLFRAYNLLPSAIRRTVKLVVAGGFGWGFEKATSSVRELGIEPDVHFVGFVPDDHLPVLYSMATVFVYPSVYEGFGLPPLEAMACGVPVIASNTSSLPEVVGKAGILVDPGAPNELAKVLEQLLRDPSRRKRLARKGLERAKKFTWKSTAEKVLDVLRETHSEGTGG